MLEEFEPGVSNYICGHHLLKAHAEAVRLYRDSYEPLQHGTIGISLASMWHQPRSDSQDDLEASQWAMQFNVSSRTSKLSLNDQKSSTAWLVCPPDLLHQRRLPSNHERPRRISPTEVLRRRNRLDPRLRRLFRTQLLLS
uniref:Lactase-phlorizin hydrolase n=1 Tax=Culex pipiens TaxID=7175 RepID=A0A8D8CJR6_CULPI